MPIRFALLCIMYHALIANVFAQEAPVTDCDTYAASDRDSQRKAPGVSLAKLNPDLAIPACEDAVRKFPDIARLNFQLGRAYMKASNFTAAAAQLRKAAERDFTLAQFDLGYMYQNGRGLPKDDQQAVLWLRKAADRGLATAQQNLGMMFQDGRGVPRDDQQAIAWLRKAADQNDVLAQFNLGVIYANGRGVPKDDQQAVIWFRKASDQGLGTAQISLGLMYARGQGVPKDNQQAMFWYRKAADQGNLRARVMLNELESQPK